MFNFQIRVSTDSFEKIKDALDIYLAGKNLIFRHEPRPDNIHYHLYLFDLHRTAEAVRDKLRKKFDKSDFAVSTTAG